MTKNEIKALTLKVITEYRSTGLTAESLKGISKKDIKHVFNYLATCERLADCKPLKNLFNCAARFIYYVYL